MTTQIPRRPAATRWIHWISAVLVLVAYLTADSAEGIDSGGGRWHVAAGVLLLVLFAPRVIGYRARGGRSMHAVNRAERITAITIHLALLLFVFVQPLLGILSVWSEGHGLPLPFIDAQMPPLVSLGEGASETLEELHETIGNVFYAVIGLHVLASLWHHFIRRDDTLRRML